MRCGVPTYSVRNSSSPSPSLAVTTLYSAPAVAVNLRTVIATLTLSATDNAGLWGTPPIQAAERGDPRNLKFSCCQVLGELRCRYFRSRSTASTIAEPPKGITVQEGVVDGGVSPLSDWLRKS